MTIAINPDDECIARISELITDIQRSAMQVAELFGKLSSEGVKRAKKQFRFVLSCGMIDRLVAAGKSDYPPHMIMTAGISVGVWRLLEPEAKTLARNKTATVHLRVGNRKDPVIKTVEQLTGPEIQQIFKVGFKGQVPFEKQVEIPPTVDKKKFAIKSNIDDFEDVDSVVASGTEFVVIRGVRGSVLKCRMKVLKHIIK